MASKLLTNLWKPNQRCHSWNLFQTTKWPRLMLPVTSSALPLIQHNRQLYSDEILGVDRFVEVRNQVNSRFGKQKDQFFERLREHIEQEENSIISEDLKNIILLCDNKEIDLLKKVIDKFEKQNESLRFGLFQFGPVVMRLAKHLNNVEMARWILDAKYKFFFNQLSSVTIAMDILFEHKQYEQIIQLFEYSTKNFGFQTKYPNDFVVFYFAACWKLNTLESFEKAFRLLRTVQTTASREQQFQLKLRGIYFFLKLAIQQNHPNIALEILHSLNLKSYSLTFQTLRLLSFAKMKRLHDIIEILRFNLKKDKAIVRPIIYHDALQEMMQLVQESKKEGEIKTIEALVKNLREAGMVETKQTLEDALVATINVTRNRNQQQGKQSQQPVAVEQRQ